MAAEVPASPQVMSTATPGHGTLPKVASTSTVPPGGTVAVQLGLSLQVVSEAATVPSLPSPPDIVSPTNAASAQSPGQPRVTEADSMFWYVMPMVQASGTPDEYGCTDVAVQVTWKRS